MKEILGRGINVNGSVKLVFEVPEHVFKRLEDVFGNLTRLAERSYIDGLVSGVLAASCVFLAVLLIMKIRSGPTC